MQNSGKKVAQALVFFCIILFAAFMHGKPIPVIYFIAGFLISAILRLFQVMTNVFEEGSFLANTALSLVIWTIYWLLSTMLVNLIYNM